jgi:hypothetical protein
MVVRFFVMVFVLMIMRKNGIGLVFMGMGGAITMMDMLVFMFKRMGMLVVVMVWVAMFLRVMLVTMFVLMVMFMVVHMIMWMFSLAHDVPPFGSDR